jgi:predicted amidohydrolase
MRTPLTLAAAQPLTVSRDVAANAHAHAKAIRSAAARVVVFPELSLTGYEIGAPAISTEDPRLAPIIEACSETKSLALAGAPVRDADGRDYIAIFAIDNGGVRVAYRKMWLGGAEIQRFWPGSAPVRIEVDGWRLGLAICRDTGIAQHAAETAALGIDAYLAGVLEFERDAHIPEERARKIAAAHGVWVAMASFAGSTGGGYERAAGHSGIWARDGTALALSGPEPDAIARGVIR